MVDKIEEEPSSAVRLQILTTSMKLFLIRAPECQKTLGTLFEKMIEDDSHMDVHDRALLCVPHSPLLPAPPFCVFEFIGSCHTRTTTTS